MKQIQTEGKKTKRFTGFLAALILILILPISAAAESKRRMAAPQGQPVIKEKFVLDLGDSYVHAMHEGGEVLYLKKMLRYQYPGVDVSDYRLKKVVLVAKSKIGRGSAQLRVGPDYSGIYRVDGRPYSFHDSSRRSFDKVKIKSPRSRSWGPWQLKLWGMFKVRKIVLVTEKRSPKNHQYGWEWMPHDRPRPEYRHHDPHAGQFHFNVRW